MDEKVLNAAFIPFGEVVDIQIPLDYESEKHRGFAFIEFELAEDAAAAIDNMVYLYAHISFFYNSVISFINFHEEHFLNFASKRVFVRIKAI